jgi:hypothetical protein
MSHCANPSSDLTHILSGMAIWAIFWFALDFGTNIFLKKIAVKYVKDDEKKDKKSSDVVGQLKVTTENVENSVHQRHKDEVKESSELININPTPTPVKTEKVANSPDLQIKYKKFERSAWRLINYSLLWVAGFCWYYTEDYSFDNTRYFENWPHAIPENINIIYTMQLGHYIYACIIIPIEPKQKDRVVLLTHHVCAIILLLGSYCHSYYRVGIVFLLVTDVSDPFLEGAKTFQYIGFQKIADILFTLFAVLFIILRNFVYPYMIIYPSYAYGYGLPDTDKMRPFLFVMQILFFYWSYVIFRIAWNLVSGKVVTDIREDE